MRRPNNKAGSSVKKFWSKLRDLGCVICDRPPNIHHVRTKRYRTKAHYRVIPLCFDHHQGNGGVHLDPKGFEERHGSEILLLIKAYKTIADSHGLPVGASEQIRRILADGI